MEVFSAKAGFLKKRSLLSMRCPLMRTP